MPPSKKGKDSSPDGEIPKGGGGGSGKKKGKETESNATIATLESPSSPEVPTDADARNDASTWPLPRWKESLVEAAVETFRVLEASQQSEWDAECARYEEYEPFNAAAALTDEVNADVASSIAHKEGERPRRNYVNSLGTIEDPDLYPYHTALYPLLDAYDPLYLDSDDEWEVSTLTIFKRQPIHDPDNVIAPSWMHPNARRYRNFYRNVEGDDDVLDEYDEIGTHEGYSPASAEATIWTLLGEDFFFQEPINGSRVQCIFGVFEDIILALASKFFSKSFRVERELKRRESEKERDLYLHSVAYEEIALPVNPVLVDRGVDATWRQGRSTHPTVLNHPLRSEGWYDPERHRRHGIEHLPPDRQIRSAVMLKILRHALSELQRDHRLAAAATFNLMLFRDFDDVSVLSNFLAICDREFGARLDSVYDEMSHDEGQGEEHEPVNPIRHEIYKFGRNISWMVAVGMVRVSREHAVALAGYCRRVFEREMGHLHTERHLHKARRGGGGETDDGDPPLPTSFRERQRWSAKRYAFLRFAEEDKDAAFTSSKKVPVSLVQEVLRALGIRAMLEKRRLLEYLDGVTENTATRDADGAVDDEVRAQSLESFHNCLFALVDIGEAIIKYLPTSERFYCIASELVRFFVYLLADASPAPHTIPQFAYLSGIENEPPSYTGQAEAKLRNLRISSSRRFADCISGATDREAALLEPWTAAGSTSASAPERNILREIEIVFRGRPPTSVQEVVRGLFVRDLVDILWAGCGYNEVCLWCRFDVTPLDPAMYWHDTSYPGDNYEDEDDEEEDDPDDRDGDEMMINWEFDEEANELNLGCVSASMDYSLMLLLREWYRPWSPENHASYPPEIRSAVKTMLHASHRVSLPAEVTHRVLEFLHRDWWPDSRRQCWNFDCQVESTQNYYNAERDARPTVPARFLTTTNYVRCHHCQIATYCSEACRSSDWKNFHKSYYNRPPCRIPGADEEAFITSLEEPGVSVPNEGTNVSRGAHVAAETGQHAHRDDAAEVAVEDDGDEEWEDEESEDEEWEDMETDDEDGVNGGDTSRAQRIYRYFRDRTYRYQD